MFEDPKLDECSKNTVATVFFFNVVIFLLFFSSKNFASVGLQPNTQQETFFYSKNIKVIVGDFGQAVKIFHWLDLISLTDMGRKTLSEINATNHQLTIYHSEAALLSAGVTSAPLSSNLTNGKGESVEIKFYLDMEKEGTNCVLGEEGHYIKYTAIQNLFHELAHAKHKMRGTWLYFASEKQAIVEENKFRNDWAKYRSLQSVAQRSEYSEGEKVVILHKGKCKEGNFASYYQ